MLLRFGVENFRSIRDRQEVSFARSALRDHDHVTVEAHGAKRGILPVLALYGANASGKSNVVAALAAMISHIEHSHASLKPTDPVPTDRFRLDPDCRDAPTHFDIDVIVDGVHYHYGFKITSVVEEEWLFAWPEGNRQLWFHRHGADRSKWRLGASLTGQRARIAELTRDNSLYLSAAAQNNHPKLLPIYRHFVSRFRFPEVDHDRPWLRSDSPLFKEAVRPDVLRLLRAADLGVVDAKVEDRTQALEKFVHEARAGGDVGLADALERNMAENGGPKELVLAHQGRSGPTWFSSADESAGTWTVLNHLHELMPALEHGGIVAIDEFDRSLHPDLARALVSLATSASTNRTGAQLLIATHDPSILEVLRRDEVVVVDKDADGVTHLTPVTEFRVLKRDNLSAAYAEGRYGGVPRLGEFRRWLEREAAGPISVEK